MLTFKLLFTFDNSNRNKMWRNIRRIPMHLWTLGWSYGRFEECCFQCSLTREFLLLQRFIDRSHSTIQRVTYEGQQWMNSLQCNSRKTGFRKGFHKSEKAARTEVSTRRTKPFQFTQMSFRRIEIWDFFLMTSANVLPINRRRLIR